jgi:hypothetical protein
MLAQKLFVDILRPFYRGGFARAFFSVLINRSRGKQAILKLRADSLSTSVRKKASGKDFPENKNLIHKALPSSGAFPQPLLLLFNLLYFAFLASSLFSIF